MILQHPNPLTHGYRAEVEMPDTAKHIIANNNLQHHSPLGEGCLVEIEMLDKGG
jgi:hypothetical protein